MSSGPIICLLKKLDLNMVDAAQVKRLKGFADSFQSQFPDLGDDAIADHALGAFKREVNLSIQHSKTHGDRLRYIEQTFTPDVKIREAKSASTYLTLETHQAERDALRVQLGSHVASKAEKVGIGVFNNLSDVDNLAIKDFVFAGKVPLNKDIAELAAGIKSSSDLIDKALFDAGASGHLKPPKNTYPISVEMGNFQTRGKLEAEALKREFFLAISEGADTQFLSLNVPYFDKFKGGLREYVDLGFESLKSGTVSVAPKLKELGISPTYFKQDFMKNIRMKDSASWNKFQSRFGSGSGADILTHTLARVQEASDHIAKLKYFGTEPKAILDSIAAKLEHTSLSPSQKDAIVSKARSNIRYIAEGSDNHSHIHYETAFNNPLTNLPFKPVKALTDLKQWMAFYLGGKATFSALLSDGIYASSTATKRGLKTNTRITTLSKLKTADQKSILKLLQDNREFATRAMLTSGKVFDVMSHSIRGMDATFGSRKVNQAASFFLRKVGLSPVTAMNRVANVLNVSYDLGELALKSFKELDPKLTTSFSKHGIFEADWDIMRLKGLGDEKGVKYISPSTLYDDNLETAAKLGRWFAEIEEAGTPTSSIVLQKFKDGMVSRSAASAAFAESLLTFQGFNGSVWANHMRGSLNDGFTGEPFKLYTAMLLKLTVFGATVKMLDNASKNKWEDPLTDDFLLNSMDVGGGLSYFGGLLSSAGRYLDGTGGGLTRAAQQGIFGAPIGTVLQFGEAVLTGLGKAAAGKDNKLSYDLFNMAYKMTPGTSFYLFKELLEENVKKPILRALNPKVAMRAEKAAEARDKKAGIEKII